MHMKPDKMISHYKIISAIGKGGMGEFDDLRGDPPFKAILKRANLPE